MLAFYCTGFPSQNAIQYAARLHASPERVLMSDDDYVFVLPLHKSLPAQPRPSMNTGSVETLERRRVLPRMLWRASNASTCQ